MQATQRVLSPKPPEVDPLRNHIEEVRAIAITLNKVDVRKENGIIIIE